jgi:CBS domain-containing protein
MAGARVVRRYATVKRTLVGEVMTTPVITAEETMPFRHLVALLYASGIGAVPVTDPVGRVLGVVSNADLIAKAAGLPADPAGPGLPFPRRRRERRMALARTAGELMTAPAVTVTPATAIGQAARIMSRHRVGRLPVRDPLTGRLAGIVTRSDLLRVYLRPCADIRAEIEAAVLSRAPAADRRRLAVVVSDGVVTISGRVELRSTALRLVTAARQAEGVIQVDDHLGYDIDDRYPATPTSF